MADSETSPVIVIQSPYAYVPGATQLIAVKNDFDTIRTHPSNYVGGYPTPLRVGQWAVAKLLTTKGDFVGYSRAVICRIYTDYVHVSVDFRTIDPNPPQVPHLPRDMTYRVG